MADVGAELHAVEPDLGDRGVRGALRQLHGIAQRGHAQHASAAGDDLPALQRGAGVEHGDAGMARIVDPVEREALKLAREYVGNKLKAAYGISLKGIHPNFKDQPEEDAKAASAELFASAIEKVAQDATILALAKKNVQAKQKATESATVDLGI